MGSSIGKSNKTLKRRSKSSAMKGSGRLSMLTQLNPEDYDLSHVNGKRLAQPARKHSEVVKEDKLILTKRGSTNSVYSGST